MIEYEISLLTLIWIILSLAGRAKLMKKSGVAWWWAFVPIVGHFRFAECADAEDDGYVYCIAETVLSMFKLLGGINNQFDLDLTFGGYALQVVIVIISLIAAIYQIRITMSLCRVFGRKKLWVIPWLLLDGPTAFLWGFSKKFVPVIRVIKKAAGLSGVTAEKLEQGLTVNIKERAIRSKLKKRVLLKDIHMNIKPGTMVLLLGGSGAGKTTFFNAVTGYEKANAVITLNGQDVYKDFDRMKYEIGLVPQQELLRTTDTVANTISDSALLRLPKTIGFIERNKRVDEVIEKFGLSKVRSNLVAKQSGGQKKRISIAMEYISDPFLFILDEPDSGLDGILARELMKGLHEISREGKIVIVVTHTPDRVIEFFDEVIVLAKDNDRTGRLVFHGPVEEAKAFFGKNTMEEIIRAINRPDEGGEGRADELIEKFTEVQNAAVG